MWIFFLELEFNIIAIKSIETHKPKFELSLFFQAVKASEYEEKSATTVWEGIRT